MSDTPPSGKPSYGSATRVAQIIHWLHHAPIGISLNELKERLQVSDRTLARYIQTLKECFFDEDGESVIEVARTAGGGRLRFKRRGVNMEGNAYELMGLYMALDLMAFLEGTFLMDGAQEALDRLQERLRREHHQTAVVLKDFHKKFFHWTEAPKDYSQMNDLLNDLVKALVLQRQIEMTYATPGKEAKTRTMQPLSLLMYKRALYLVARLKGSDGVIRDITFAVERIKSVKILEDSFSYPHDYNPEGRFQHSFGLVSNQEPVEVRLHFHQTVAPNVGSRRWHPSQEITETEDGLEMVLNVNPSQEFIAWLLGYGHFVRVLEPESLVQTMRHRLQQALEQYSGN